MYPTSQNRQYGPSLFPRNKNRYTISPIRGRNAFDRLQPSGSSLVASTSLMKWVKPKEASDSEASLSSGYGDHYCDNGVNVAILALTLAGLAAMFYVLYTKITMLVGRRRRHAEDYNSPVQKLPYTYTYNIDEIISDLYWGMIKLIPGTLTSFTSNYKRRI